MLALRVSAAGLGQGNNHHALVSSAKFSAQPWQFDIGRLYIRMLCALRLARVKKIAPRLYRDPTIDEDTVEALTTHRSHMPSEYRLR